MSDGAEMELFIYEEVPTEEKRIIESFAPDIVKVLTENIGGHINRPFCTGIGNPPDRFIRCYIPDQSGPVLFEIKSSELTTISRDELCSRVAQNLRQRS